MADNFNLRSFLSENKLTKNAQLLNELTVVNEKPVDLTSIEVDGDYPSDVYIVSADFEDGTRLSDEEVQQLEIDYPNLAGEVGYDKQTSGFDYDEDYGVEEAYTPKSKLEQVIQQAWAEPDLEKAKQIVHDLIEPSKVKSKDTILQTIKGINSKPKLDQYLANSLLKFEKLGLSEDDTQISNDTIQKKYNEMFGRNPSTTFADVAKALGIPEDRVGMAVQSGGMKFNETTNKMTTKEKELVKMVQEAMGMEGYGDDNVNLKRDKQGLPQQQGPTYSEGEEIAEEEMVQKESLPKYESIEKLMQEIEEGTNKAMYEYKMNRMTELAEMIEAKVGSLEEGDHKDYINKKDVDQMRKDIKKLRDGEAKLRKEFDKKFNKKEKTAAPKKEEAPVTLAEGTFDLRKFLAENRK
jgi:hypothetical protein